VCNDLSERTVNKHAACKIRFSVRGYPGTTRFGLCWACSAYDLALDRDYSVFIVLNMEENTANGGEPVSANDNRVVATTVAEVPVNATTNDSEDVVAVVADSLPTSDDDKHRHRHHRHSKKDSEVTKLPSIITPQCHPDWVRYFDQQQNIYYLNAVTGASAWLLPCCQCQEAADRWCITCKRSYCEHDFRKRHGKSAIREKHKWQFKELLDTIVLPPGEEYCVACVRKGAFKMCLECWEPYCLTCFGLVHHVGALKLHKSMPYKRAKMGWMTVKDYANGTEKYVHGETGDTTTERPLDLYSDLERLMFENINIHKAALEEHAQLIEKLKAELEVVQKEKERAVVETSKALNEMRARAAEREKAEASNAAKSKKQGGSATSKKS
jgi:hypothetical protein